MKIKIKKLHPDAVIPQYATPGAAGFDLVAVEDVIIKPGETKLVPTGIALEIPQGYELQVRPRSGITLKTKLRIGNSPGTVDSDYRSGIGVIVDNIAHPKFYTLNGTLILDCDFPLDLKDQKADEEGEMYPAGTYIIRKGDRIAQGVIAPVIQVEFEEVDELSETERGSGGFGSTGIN